MEGLNLSSIIAKNAEIVTADMDGEIVMMRIETGKYYNLGKMGSVIWAMLETPISLETLIEKLLEKFDVGCEQCEKEVLSFLCETYKEGLVTIG